MKADDFRELALDLPEAVEQEHHGHPDFRVGKKIFATLGPDGDWGMVKLKPDEQRDFIEESPDCFAPASGAWGRSGSTIVQLRKVRKSLVRSALELAWRNVVPKRLLPDDA